MSKITKYLLLPYIIYREKLILIICLIIIPTFAQISKDIVQAFHCNIVMAKRIENKYLPMVIFQ